MLTMTRTLLATAAFAVSLPAAAQDGGVTPWCAGEYTDDLAALSPSARQQSADATKAFSYCIRDTAVYECLSYGQEGEVQRTMHTVTSHGTGFGWRREASATYLVTNEHVVEWPTITTDEHPVEDVPKGCKRLSNKLRIVEKESDEFTGDDIHLSVVATDPQLDLAVVKAPSILNVIPWAIGRSKGIDDALILIARLIARR